MTDHTIIAPGGPQRVGKYLIRARLGEGAMGVVYEAHDRDIDRTVAIKTVHKHLIDAAGGADWLARFSREARAAGRVLHPNLVTIFDYLEQDGLPYLVMERLDAQTLEQRLTEPRPLCLSQVADIMAQLLDGLATIHAAKIVHRDMKPANIMLTQTGGVKLTDFGIARFTQMEHTGAGMIGTPAYMAPEQFSGAQVDARADIYAAGVVLYEVLTGQQPYRGGGITAVMMAGKGQSAPPPSTHATDLPTALDAVVMRAIAADPADRYPGADEMRTDLMAAIGGHGGARTTPRPAGQVPSAATMIGKLSVLTMRGLEESLVSQIGPIGKILARRAAQTAVTHDDLLTQLLDEITDPAEREALRRQISGLLHADPGHTPGGVAEADLGVIIAALTPHLGPIAGTLVRRQARHATNLPQLLDSVAEAIPDLSARAEFLQAIQTQSSKGTYDA
ncbi:serine/threonine-protein kinase [Roseobacter sp.]|uniref:serine/threonine-protein kinase n=1 Tax=Roseobacter sp. TaxID=1907202 RepID=UPI00329849C7